MARLCEVQDCDRKHVAKGMCQRHYEGYRRNGHTDLRPKATSLAEALRLYTVDNGNGCLTWTGPVNEHGRPRTSIDGTTQYVHRALWQYVYGDASDYEIDHACRNVACVRLNHLRKLARTHNLENHSGAYSNNRLGMRGVHQRRNGLYYGQVYHNKVRYGLGPFNSAEEADRAVTAKRNELYTYNDIDKVRAF